MKSKTTEIHTLYRFFDRTGLLLYVGITMDPPARFRSHSNSKKWYNEVSNIRLEQFPDRRSLESAEQFAILSEQPKYNVVYNTLAKQHQKSNVNIVGEWPWRNQDKAKTIPIFRCCGCDKLMEIEYGADSGYLGLRKHGVNKNVWVPMHVVCDDPRRYDLTIDLVTLNYERSLLEAIAAHPEYLTSTNIAEAITESYDTTYPHAEYCYCPACDETRLQEEAETA